MELDRLVRHLPRRVEAFFGRPAALVLSLGSESLTAQADSDQLADALVPLVAATIAPGGGWVEIRAGRQAVTLAGLAAPPSAPTRRGNHDPDLAPAIRPFRLICKDDG